MSDQAEGVVLLVATVFLWLTGSFLQLHIIKKLEKPTDRMRRAPAPQGQTARRGRLRVAAVSRAPEDRLSAVRRNDDSRAEACR
jgi:hypothetical protein